jgi:hypothetical protein
MKDVVARLQRELPDTDKDRYDVAYERGRAQARSALLAGGLAAGTAIGAGMMWLLDPIRGANRRAQLSERASGLTNQLSKRLSGKADDLGNRVTGFAIEHGVKQPDGGASDDATTRSGGGAWDTVTHPGSYAESPVGQADLTGTTPVATASRTSSVSDSTDYGEGYREGFGATEHDPTAPGSQVPDPIKPDEAEAFGSSGPVAGAAHETSERASVISRETEEHEAATSR